ncbi:MAG: ATP-binding protein [Mycobacteriales bacterium]
MANPFHYGTPVAGAQFAGRTEELRALIARMRDGINVVVASPRRYGKTSLITKAALELERSGAAVVQVNVLRCRDLPTFASQLLTHAYRARHGGWHRLKHGVPDFVRRFRITPGLGFDATGSPRFTFAPTMTAADADAVIADVYALLAELSAKGPAVLVLDEFQAITDLGEHLPGLLKALADEHPTVSLVVAGSKKHLMERLVTTRDAPLFGMAEHLALDVLPADVMTSFLVRRSRAGGKDLPRPVAQLVVTLAGPVPNDVQHLAYEVFDVAGATITEADVHRGLTRAVEHEAGLHADRFEALAAGQRRVVAELALTPTSQPLSAAFVRAVRLANSSSVRKALEALRASELVVVRDGVYQVADPFFAAWLRA